MHVQKHIAKFQIRASTDIARVITKAIYHGYKRMDRYSLEYTKSRNFRIDLFLLCFLLSLVCRHIILRNGTERNRHFLRWREYNCW